MIEIPSYIFEDYHIHSSGLFLKHIFFGLGSFRQGRRNRGARGAMVPHFLGNYAKCPFEAQNGHGNVPLLGHPHFLGASYVPAFRGGIRNGR